MIIKNTKATDTDFVELCHQLDTYLNDLVGGEKNRAEYIPYNLLTEINNVVIAYENDVAVGCASYKDLSENTAEVKRVFVQEEYRGRKIAKHLMLALEERARQQGFYFFVLETGEPLVSATKLYLNLGYRAIDNYGPYIDMPESVCMKKEL